MGRPRKTAFITKSFGDTPDEELTFLHNPYLPVGCYSHLMGDPSRGKTLYAVALCAYLSIGKAMPMALSDEPPVTGNALYLSTENDVGRDLKKRLLANGGDVDKVFYIPDQDVDLAENCSFLENAVRERKARLVVLDPLVSYLGKNGGDTNGVQMRRFIDNATKIAKKYNCVLMGVGHLTKSNNPNVLMRGNGSIALPAAARSTLLIDVDIDDPETRVVQHVKSNFTRPGAAFAFNIGDNAQIEFLGEFDGKTANGVSVGRKLAQAKKLIVSLLAESPQRSSEVLKAGEDAGIGARTMNEAKKELGVVSEQLSDGWYWVL